MKANWVGAGILSLGLSVAGHSSVVFNTFVTAGNIAAAEGQHDTIGFTYAGDKFVGTVYFQGGGNNRQLYQTNLTGGGVTLFGSPLPSSTTQGEIVVAGSLNQAGFGNGTVYAGALDSTLQGVIYKYGDLGGAPTLFTSNLNGGLRGLLFDPGTTFGGGLLAVTNAGSIYTINSLGVPTLLVSTGEDTEGMDIIPSDSAIWGAFAGDLVTASEGSGRMRIIDPLGNIVFTSAGGFIPQFETVNYVPTAFSGNPLEGYYAANFAVDIQKADAGQFAGLGGHLLATSEDGSNARVWDIQYNGGTSFSVNQVGSLPNQAEDGIFVTAQRIADTSTPEPGSVLTMAGGLLGLWAARRRYVR